MKKYIDFHQQRYVGFKDTLKLCSNVTLNSNFNIEWLVFEELNVDIPCYLCDENLNDFLDSYMIDEEIQKMAVQLRNNFLEIQNNASWNADSILHSKNWEITFKLSIDILNKLYPSEKYDAIILGVAHKEFLSLDISSLIKDNAVVYDVKGILDREMVDGRL